MKKQDYLRPLKGDLFYELHNSPLKEKSTLSCKAYKNASVLPIMQDNRLLFGKGGVVDSNGEYIKESGICGRIDGSYNCEKEYIDKKVVYLGYAINHWGHFLIEGVTRLWYFLKHKDDESIDAYIFIVEKDASRIPYGNYKVFLELIGIWDKLIFINKPSTFKEVIVPEIAFEYRSHTSKEYLDIFNAVIEAAMKDCTDESYPSKIYFSRMQFGKANETEFGMEIIDDFFSKNGFTILSPEKLGLADTIRYIQKASVCAMASGSLPHNMLFAKNRTKVIEIERQAIYNPVQIEIDKIKELDITYVDANYAIYPVIEGWGPFMYAANKHLQSFAKDNNLLPPSKPFKSQGYILSMLRSYYKEFRKQYGYGMSKEDWHLKYANTLYEAYLDTNDEIGKYLNGDYCLVSEFSFLSKYLKSFAKRVLKKIGLRK